MTRSTHTLVLTVAVLLLAVGCQQIREYRQEHYVKAGRQLMESGEYAEAARAFENALVFDRDSIEISEMLGEAYMRSERWQDASVHFREVGRGRPDDEAVMLRWLECLLQAGKSRGAAGVSQQYLEKHPESEAVRMYFLRGAVKSRINELVDSALAMLEEMLGAGSTDQRLYALQAEIFVLRGRLAEAERILRRHVADIPEWVSAMEVLAEKFVAEEKKEQSIDLYELLRATVGPLEQEQYRERLLQLLRDYGMQERELQLLRSMLDTPEAVRDSALVVRLANACIYYGLFQEAEAVLREALQRAPEDMALNTALIALYAREQDWARAIAVAKRSVEQTPDESPQRTELLSMLADLYYETGDCDQALAITRDVLEIEPNNARANFVQCKVMFKNDDITTLAGRLRLLINSNTDVAEYHYWLGCVYERQNIETMAETAFKDALESDLGYRDALEKLLALYEKKGYWRERIELIEAYLTRHPDDAGMQERLQALQAKTGY